MKIPHILVNSANVLHILPILVNSAMLVNSASINMQYYEYFAYTNGDVTGVQGPFIDEAVCDIIMWKTLDTIDFSNRGMVIELLKCLSCYCC